MTVPFLGGDEPKISSSRLCAAGVVCSTPFSMSVCVEVIVVVGEGGIEPVTECVELEGDGGMGEMSV